MPLGSLEDHLHDLPPDKEPLDWNTRMKIAGRVAKGLEYLHDKVNPRVVPGTYHWTVMWLGFVEEKLLMKIAHIHEKISHLTRLVSELPESEKSMLKDLNHEFEEKLILNIWISGRRRFKNYGCLVHQMRRLMLFFTMLDIYFRMFLVSLGGTADIDIE